MIKKANKGKSLEEFSIVRIEVWHEWLFSPKGIKPVQPKWVTTYNTQPFLPTQATPVLNLSLAGAHTKTEADVWSIEGAVESDRRAAAVIEPGIQVIPQYKPLLLKFMAKFDDLLFFVGAPQLMDVVGIGVLIAILLLIIAPFFELFSTLLRIN